MSYSDSFPAQRPIFSLDAANAGRLDPRMTFSRASTANVWDGSKHLSSENILLQSSDFDTTWSRDSSLNAPTGSQTAPDGSSTAWLLTTAASGTDSPFLLQNPSGAVANGTVCTYVMHIKAGTASHAYISFRGAYSSAAWALIDFASPTSPTTGGSLGSISATSVALGSSWYRVALTFNTGTVSSGYPYVYVGASDGTSPDSTGRVTWTYSGETIYAWGAQLSTTQSKVYDSPTTTQIHREYAPSLVSKSNNVGRFDHTTDGQSVGILIESQSTNLLGNSADFGGSWQILNATKSIEAIGPDGTLSAIAFREGTNSSEKRLFSYFNNGGGNVTFSVYAKILGNARRLVIREAIYTGLSAVFDLATGTKVSGNGSIESVGNGWYRCQLNFSSSQPTPGVGFYIIPADGESYTASAFAGDGYSGLLLTMPQAENQSFASSYINTGIGGGTATRAAESLSTSISEIGYSGNTGTLLIDVEGGYGAYPCAVALHDGAGYERAMIARDSSTADDSTDFYAFVGDKSGTSSTLTLSGSGSASKVALSFATDDFAATAGGGTVVTSTSGVSPAAHLTTLQIGAQIASNQWNGHVKRVALYGEALSDTNLQALTS